MLSLAPSSNLKKTTPNILPAKIHHNGPIPIAQRHWNPQPTPNSTTQEQTVYLRGRKLLGKKVPLPEGYEGVVLQKSEKTLPKPRPEDGDGNGEGEEDVEVRVMEEKGRFQEVVVWGHEVVSGEEDVYRKGVEEWVGFAEALRHTNNQHDMKHHEETRLKKSPPESSKPNAITNPSTSQENETRQQSHLYMLQDR
ncbi:hypothetical protein PRZ48_014216 [Zasmidium cellare]|uniref:Uncharacterized protein n=1 Tax=Zasmidium cellare TaxID=395010 RepID=A0ABR0E0S6_ZASCE|nr:hypothetical protein PRZ48_014216 [Zasmidium cellare]